MTKSMMSLMTRKRMTTRIPMTRMMTKKMTTRMTTRMMTRMTMMIVMTGIWKTTTGKW